MLHDTIRPDARPIIYVIDDEPAVCTSVAMLLQEIGWGVETFATADTFLSCLDKMPTGIILSDVRLPNITGIELVRSLAQNGRRDPAIVMTAHADIALAVEAMKAGAVEFLEKPFEVTALEAALESALRAMPSIIEEETCHRFQKLSPRERDVYCRVVEGATNKVVARQLGLSPRTVDVYRASIMAKMNVCSIAELALTVTNPSIRANLRTWRADLSYHQR